MLDKDYTHCIATDEAESMEREVIGKGWQNLTFYFSHFPIISY